MLRYRAGATIYSRLFTTFAPGYHTWKARDEGSARFVLMARVRALPARDDDGRGKIRESYRFSYTSRLLPNEGRS